MPGTGNERDDAVLWVVIGFCLITPVVLLTLWAYSSRFYPPMLLAILLGIAIAALTYRYLGGTDGSTFSVGALKIVGSAALLLGTTYMVNIGLSAQMDADNSPNKLATARSELKAAREEIENIRSALNLAEKNKSQLQLSEIKKLSPASEIGASLAEMARRRQGPFSEVVRVLNIKATVVATAKIENNFFACANLDLDGDSVRISHESNNEPKSIHARKTGTIESVVCDRENRNFDIQLSCPAGQILFPKEVSGCTKNGDVKWKYPEKSRIFPVSLEVLAAS